jgi:hypothetical protein
MGLRHIRQEDPIGAIRTPGGLTRSGVVDEDEGAAAADDRR